MLQCNVICHKLVINMFHTIAESIRYHDGPTYYRTSNNNTNKNVNSGMGHIPQANRMEQVHQRMAHDVLQTPPTLPFNTWAASLA